MRASYGAAKPSSLPQKAHRNRGGGRMFFSLRRPSLEPPSKGKANENNAKGADRRRGHVADRAQRRAGAGALLRRVRFGLSGILSALPGILPALFAATAPSAGLCRAAAGLLRAAAGHLSR